MLHEIWLGLKRYWALSWWWKGPTLALFFIVAITIIGAITGGGAEDDTTDGSVAEQTSEVTSEPTEEPTAEPTEAPTPEPTPQPTPEPTPEPGFGDGTRIVGQDVQPGTYRSSGDSLCYWARLRGFSEELDDIIANGNNAPEIVTVSQTDAGFETRGCGRWIPLELTASGTAMASFNDGTYQVGVHIAPGQYSAAGAELCYWARLSDFSHELSGIITNGNNATVIEISPTDAGFTTFGCGTWTRR